METPLDYPQNLDAMVQHLQTRLPGVFSDATLEAKAAAALEINRLKKEKNAIILGHNYMEPALYQSVPDYTGDSLYLSRIAAQTEARTIVFCGVRFMAETAKILSPQRQVLLPSEKGGCSLAASITAKNVQALKTQLPGVPVVSYVNTYAEVKAETDICCTSGNAHQVVRHLLDRGEKRIIFLPDEYLASNVAQELGLQIVLTGPDRPLPNAAREPEPEAPLLVGWAGRCEVHEQFTVEDIQNARQTYPEVQVLAHPECSPDVVAAADFAGSTMAMIRYVQNMQGGRYLLLTECAMGDNIVAQTPDRQMVRLCSLRCPHMQEVTLEQTLESLRQERYAVELEETLMARARASLDRMIGIG